jgi:hypothetical protein
MTVPTNSNPHGCILITYKAESQDKSNRIGQNLLLTLSDVMREFGKTKRYQVKDQIPREVTKNEYDTEVRANHTTEQEWDRAIAQYDHYKFE